LLSIFFNSLADRFSINIQMEKKFYWVNVWFFLISFLQYTLLIWVWSSNYVKVFGKCIPMSNIKLGTQKSSSSCWLH
jgi:hypothetical protein